MIDTTHLNQLTAQQLRETLLSLIETTASQSTVIERKDREIAFKQAVIDKITHEMAVLKRLKFAAKSEAFEPTVEWIIRPIARQKERGRVRRFQDSGQ